MMHGWKSDVSKVRRLVALGALSALLWLPAGASAQSNDQFGGQQRADAASRMIVLGVQQGISSLPPTSGQSLLYEFDPELDTYVASQRLGPTSFRAPQTVGAGKFSFRVATSYFELADSFAPIPYEVFANNGTPQGVAQFGLKVNAHVGLINVGTNYGITNRFEVSINVPLSVVDAHASQVFTTRTNALPTPARQAPVSGVCLQSTANPACKNADVPAALNDLGANLTNGTLSYREESFAATGQKFKTENHLGIGRISLGAKAVIYSDPRFQVAFAPEFFMPSPSEGAFAGSETASVFPRILAALSVTDYMKLHVDAGYDNDFDSNQLRRFVWDFGTSLPFSFATFDAGVGGSKFNEGIKWTPDSATFSNTSGAQVGTIQNLGDNTLGDNFIDALGGVKVRIAEKSVISGAVNVPLNNEGFRAAAVGTLAVEFYF